MPLLHLLVGLQYWKNCIAYTTANLPDKHIHNNILYSSKVCFKIMNPDKNQRL